MTDKPDKPVKCPSDLQLSIPPETRGLSWNAWMYRQTVCDPAALRAWIAIHGSGAPKPVEPPKAIKRAAKRQRVY